MSIQAVIWDLGGVLLRTEDKSPRQALAQRLGMTLGEIEDFVFNHESGKRAQRGEVDITQHWNGLMQELGWPLEDLPIFQQSFFGGDRLDEDLLAYIHSLRPRYRLGLLSNAFSDLRHLLADVWHIDHVFDALIISAEVGVMKPDQYIYQVAVERLGVAAQETVFIDDFQHNVAGARAAGLRAIQFHTSQQVRIELETLLQGVE